MAELKSYQTIVAEGVCPPSDKKKSYFLDRTTGNIVETDKTHPDFVKMVKKEKEQRAVQAVERRKERVANNRKAKAKKLAEEAGFIVVDKR